MLFKNPFEKDLKQISDNLELFILKEENCF